jgi:ATP-dependent Clp protease ATP-binding subunit ClpA
VHHGKGLRSPPLPSFSRPLEESLHRAVAYANQRKHEYATLEHLLLSLTDDEDAAGVMRACDVDLGALKKSLVNYLDTELKPRWSSTTARTPSPPPASSA